MMRTKLSPYTCPKCGYESNRKDNMVRHFNNKKPCPSQNSIELTDEVKTSVLQNRIYHPPKHQPTINQQINNIQYIQNFVSSMDPMDKIKTYCEYKEINPISIEDYFNDKYEKIVERLQENKYKYGYQLCSNDFLDIINDSCSMNGNIENLNVFFDEKSNKLKLYLDDWNEYFIDIGIERLICHLKDYYLDYYEDYLFKQLVNIDLSIMDRKKYDELIDEYYKFLIAFNIRSKNDDDGFDRYEKIKNATLPNEKKEWNKKVITILKTNSKQNIGLLNCKIVSLFHMEEHFKKALIEKILKI